MDESSSFSALGALQIRDRRRRRPVQDRERSERYAAQTPEPNYSQFGQLGVQYVDFSGREYRLASGPIVRQYARAGAVRDVEFLEPDRQARKLHFGTQVFWVRIPIYLRGTVGFPDAQGEHLELYFTRDQVLCKGTTDGVYVSGPRKKTGTIVLRDFTTFGQLADPSRFEQLVVQGRKQPQTRAPF